MWVCVGIWYMGARPFSPMQPWACDAQSPPILGLFGHSQVWAIGEEWQEECIQCQTSALDSSTRNHFQEDCFLQQS